MRPPRGPKEINPYSNRPTAFQSQRSSEHKELGEDNKSHHLQERFYTSLVLAEEFTLIYSSRANASFLMLVWFDILHDPVQHGEKTDMC